MWKPPKWPLQNRAALHREAGSHDAGFIPPSTSKMQKEKGLFLSLFSEVKRNQKVRHVHRMTLDSSGRSEKEIMNPCWGNGSGCGGVG